jgi:hypothetical protein
LRGPYISGSFVKSLNHSFVMFDSA